MPVLLTSHPPCFLRIFPIALLVLPSSSFSSPLLHAGSFGTCCLRGLPSLVVEGPCVPSHAINHTKHSHRQRHSHRSAHDCKFRRNVGRAGWELAGLHSSTTKHSNVSEELATAVPVALLMTRTSALTRHSRDSRAREARASVLCPHRAAPAEFYQRYEYSPYQIEYTLLASA